MLIARQQLLEQCFVLVFDQNTEQSREVVL